MILDQYSNPISSKRFLEGAQTSFQRVTQSTAAKDFDELITELDWKTIIGASRRLYSNDGIVKGTIDQKSSYTIGNSFLPQYLGEDKAWGKVAEEWLLNWYEICDVRGLFDMQTHLFLSSVAVDRDGDAFTILSRNEVGFPMIQSIPAHRIGQRDNSKRVASGKYKGHRICKGVVSNKYGRPIAYHFIGDTEGEDRFIPSNSTLQLFDPSYVDQGRGLPLFAHAINTFRDLRESEEREMAAQLLLASLAFVEHNEFGAADYDNATVERTPSGEPVYQSFESGQIKFFKAGDGSKLEEVANNRPSQNYQSFHDRLITKSLVGTGWPKALTSMAQGNGTADRISLLQGKKAIADRQHLLKPYCKRIITYALSCAIDAGILPPSKGFWKWDFSTNHQLSIDLGRDSNSLREEYKLGLKNLTQILAEEGKTLEAHLRERAAEEALEKSIREEFKLEPLTQ